MASWMGYPTDPDFSIFKLVKPWRLTKERNITLEDEDMEDESTMGELINPGADLINPAGAEMMKPTSRAENTGQEHDMVNTTARPGSNLSSDSLAFTLVYCSVFTLTLLYIGFKLSKKWRKQGRLAGGLEEPAHPGRCNHAACQHVHGSTSLPGYAGMGAIWIPELRGTAGRATGPPGHTTAQCNNSCENCKRLQQPPPSYTNLFLEENPPSYTDAIDVEETVTSADSTAVGCSAANCTVVGCTDDNQLCPSYSVSEFMYANKHGFAELFGGSTQSISQTDSTQHSTENILTHPANLEDGEDHIMVEIHSQPSENPQIADVVTSTDAQTNQTAPELSTASQTSSATSSATSSVTSSATSSDILSATSRDISSATATDLETSTTAQRAAEDAIEEDSDSSEITETTEFIDTVSSSRPLEIRAS